MEKNGDGGSKMGLEEDEIDEGNEDGIHKPHMQEPS